MYLSLFLFVNSLSDMHLKATICAKNISVSSTLIPDKMFEGILDQNEYCGYPKEPFVMVLQGTHNR